MNIDVQDSKNAPKPPESASYATQERLSRLDPARRASVGKRAEDTPKTARLGYLRAATGDALSSIEVLPRIGIEIALEFDSEVVDPLANKHDWYAIVEVSGTKPDGQTRATLEAALAEAMDKGIVLDAAIAASTAQPDWPSRCMEAMATRFGVCVERGDSSDVMTQV